MNYQWLYFSENYVGKINWEKLKQFYNSSFDFDPGRELVVSHLENNREITTKTGLIRSLKSYYVTYE